MNYLKHISILLISCIFYSYPNSICFSQPLTEWVSQYNSSSNQNDHVNDMIIDSLGNIYLCGYIEYNTNLKDVLLLKYNSSGNLLWSRTWRGTGSSLNTSGASKILFDNEGFIYLLGTASIENNVLDYLVMKYSPEGDTVWVRTFDGTNENVDDGRDIIIDKNNNIYITGMLARFGNVDNGTIKYDKNGKLKWWRKFPEYSTGSILLDSEYVFIGGTSNSNIAILKYDTLGNSIDTIFYETVNSDGAQLMVFDKQKNLITSGLEDAGLPTQYNIVTAKLSQTGIKSWISVFNNNFDNIPEYLYDLKTDTTGNVLILARSRNQQSQRAEIALIKYDNINGDSLWTRKYNLVPLSNDAPSKMRVDKNNNVYIIGASDSSVFFSRMLIIKYNQSGQLQWHKVYYPTLFSNTSGACILIDKYNNIYASGVTNIQQTSDDIVLIKYSQLTNLIQSNFEIPDKFELYQNYPNPFNLQTEIKFDLIKNGIYSLEIFDMTGRSAGILFQEYKNAGSYVLRYNAANFASGLYFYKLSSSEFAIIKKFVLIK